MFSDRKMWKHNNVHKCIEKLKARWIHMLLVGQPANFRFNGKNISHEDSSLLENDTMLTD